VSEVATATLTVTDVFRPLARESGRLAAVTAYATSHVRATVPASAAPASEGETG
jgi:hypothetical protein